VGHLSKTQPSTVLVKKKFGRLSPPGGAGKLCLLAATLLLQTTAHSRFPRITLTTTTVGRWASRAPQVMMIGWGEGLDQAARYLNDQPEAPSLRLLPGILTDLSRTCLLVKRA